jgi:lipopolysaccharide biosynthesis glycosyltransferase
MLIVCATDRHFAELAGVMIRSVCLNGCVPEAEFVVFSDGLRVQDKDRIAACADRSVEFIDLAGPVRVRLSGVRTKTIWPISCLARLLAADYLSERSDRMLYLDCDIVVRGDLRPLFDLDLEGNVVAAHGNAGGLTFTNSARIPPGAFYCNSGVLMIDTKAWVRDGIADKTISWARNNAPVYFDQDAINAVLHHRILPLDVRWNWQVKRTDDGSPAIIHFTGTKPNHDYHRSRWRDEFLSIRAQTPWADSVLISRNQNKLDKFWRRLKRIPTSLYTRLCQQAGGRPPEAEMPALWCEIRGITLSSKLDVNSDAHGGLHDSHGRRRRVSGRSGNGVRVRPRR